MVGGDGYFMLFLLGPVAALLLAAFGDSGGLWGHLVDTVLATYVTNTLLLMGGVGIVAIVFGVSSAWVISRYDFAGRDMLEWMLLLPAAIPYIIAYCYTDFSNMQARSNRRYGPLLAAKSARLFSGNSVGWWGGIGYGIGALSLYLHGSRIAFRLTPASLFEIALVPNRNFGMLVCRWHGLPLSLVWRW